MQAIYVKNKDFGFWTQQEITVQRFEEVDEGVFELIYCNHAGAETQENENELHRPDQDDVVYTTSALVCKCRAYKLSGESEWYDAPVEGAR